MLTGGNKANMKKWEASGEKRILALIYLDSIKTIYVYKHTTDGAVERYIVRLVARGFAKIGLSAVTPGSTVRCRAQRSGIGHSSRLGGNDTELHGRTLQENLWLEFLDNMMVKANIAICNHDRSKLR